MSAPLAQLVTSLQEPNVRAFLRAIRLGEGTSDHLGYKRLVGGGEFDSYAHHPRQRVWIPRYKVWSTAAGAYQLIWPTWNVLRQRYKLPDFSPHNQDIAALALVSEKSALADVIHGRIESAVSKCAPVWASLPGSKAGQRTETFASFEGEYRKHGGEVAA